MTDRTLTVAGVEVVAGHWIGGEPTGPDGATFEVTSPIDGATLGQVAAGGAADVDRAVTAARAAFPAWRALGPEGRGEVLDRLAQGLLDRTDELAAVETIDNGSLLVANHKRLVGRAAHNLSFFAEAARRLDHPTFVGEVVVNQVRYEPAGVAGLITPWNAPLMLSTWKVGPALAAGNTAVLKPPEWAPLSCSLLAEIAVDAGVPPGVLNVVQGSGPEAGDALVRHPDVDRVSFTGSVATGRVVGAAAAASVTPVSLELGGKSPLLVFADADLEEAATTIVGQFANAGQVCLAGTRILVDAAVEGELAALVRKAAEAWTVGDPRERGVRVGPLIHPRQFERVDGMVRRAVHAGAVAVLGGGPHERGGLYYRPTILAGVAQDAEIVQEEIFGPVLTWQTFGSEAEAVALANGTAYGLAGMVFTGDADRADRVAAELVAGTVWVNCFFVRDLDAPFGGARTSGVGREGGSWSFDFYCDVKNVAVRRGSFCGSERRG
jgi:5-carboxymethyl-2-hydroxymuconic-semialdehyde dehydrogenase